MGVFDVVEENCKNVKDFNLSDIKRVFYNDLELSDLEKYTTSEDIICNCLKEDPQLKILCSLLSNTFILKMNNEINESKFSEVLKDYALMIDFLTERYDISITKKYCKIG